MKSLFLFIIIIGVLGCQGKIKENSLSGNKGVPVYSVDLDRLDSVSVFDLFSKIDVIPLETTEKSRIATAEFGIHNNRYLILDKAQGLCFCFGTDGKFRYVVDNKAKVSKKLLPDGSKPVNIKNSLSYYYDFQWYHYLTYRNSVYTKNKEGDRTIRYHWDFGKYNNKDKEPDVLESSIIRIAIGQKEWMQENVAFALSEAKQNDEYIYTLVERIFLRPGIYDKGQFVHLFWHKPSGSYQFFTRFTEGVDLSRATRMNDTCMMALVSYAERDNFVKPELLDAKNLQRYKQMQPDDNPMIVRYYFRKEE